jgi:hypothetical protein
LEEGFQSAVGDGPAHELFPLLAQRSLSRLLGAGRRRF